MAYTKTTWATGDVISAEKLNNIESGIEGLETEIGTAVGAVDAKADSAVATAEGISDAVDEVAEQLEEIGIDGYSKKWVELDTTPKSGYVYGRSGNIIEEKTMSGWEYRIAPVKVGKEYKLKGTKGSSVPLYVYFDSEMKTVLVGTYGSSTANATETVAAPARAAFVVVNGQTNQTKITTESFTFTMTDALYAPIELQEQVDALAIEGYEKVFEPVEGTLEAGMVYSRSGSVVSKNAQSGWEVRTMPVTGGASYKLTGWCTTTYPLYVWLNASGNVSTVGPYSSAYGGGFKNVTEIVTAPSSAKFLAVNSYTNQSKLYAKGMTYSQGDPIAVQKSTNQWSVQSDKFVETLGFISSSNGALNDVSLYYNGAEFKIVHDDMAPLQLANDGGYIGANHGYNFIYTATLADHGLTEADIGKTCEVGGNTWVLVQVPSDSTFNVVCKEDSNFYGVKAVAGSAIPSTFDFGTPITVTSVAAVAQFEPGTVRNINVEIISNTKEEFLVLETYDIFDMKSSLAEVIENVGSNDNSSLTNSGGVAMTVRNLYSVQKGCVRVAYHDLKFVNPDYKLYYYGGTQSQCFGSGDYYAVPMTSKADFSASPSSSYYFDSSMWDDADVPPFIYIQINAAPGSATKAIVQGILLEDRKNWISRAGFISSAKKMYPFAFNPSSAIQTGVRTYSFAEFRLPIQAFAMDADIRFCQYCKVKSDYYMFIYHNAAVDKLIKLPQALLGKRVEVLTSNGAECLNDLTTAGIDFRTTAGGYVVLKLTDYSVNSVPQAAEEET